MEFKDEAEFESALIKVLSEKGWEKTVLKDYDEAMLLENWADILYKNNSGIDRLNGQRLTDSEMAQIVDQIKTLKTPLRLNGFINGKTISITRDNPADKLHYGKEISLKIYDRSEIAGGQSRYQIAEQTHFAAKDELGRNRRGDLTLLINGMPVIHIELKKEKVPVKEACWQIQKYSREDVFTGLFGLVQIFLAMTPSETLYFANPGPQGKFNDKFFFHWADKNNTPINNWKDIAESLLSIPMAHQLIGFYTVADDTDQVLKVMRSYQYYAASAVADKVAKHVWDSKEKLGGYIWHTTGSGKTMTSFKAAQLIANSNDADKVIFLTDRIELGTQSLAAYKNFADDSDSVQATEDTSVLIQKLKSKDPADVLIVTSIQKMSRVHFEENGSNVNDICMIRNKRLVFIIDEAHRSTFGDMLVMIKNTFPRALYFGFTGTPIQEENQKKLSTTATILGDELHRYSIADGIRDKNVLGFDIYQVKTFSDTDLRNQVALRSAHAETVQEAMSKPDKAKIYNKFMDPNQVRMAGYIDYMGKEVKGIEDYVPRVQYETSEHRLAIIEDIRHNWDALSRGGMFHAIFATQSINDAIDYYRLIKAELPDLKVACLFDETVENDEGFDFKSDALLELLRDYNTMYFGGPNKGFDLPRFQSYKKDVALRLAHKGPYSRIDASSGKQLDMLIVVRQMLTGYDSKWVNTLYVDKVMEYEDIIQAFSRTNRIFGDEKPFGIIRYYRYPNTMEQNINKAVKLYSGDRVTGFFVDKLPQNIRKMNVLFDDISDVFRYAGINDFGRLPDDASSIAKFAQLFNSLNVYLEAAEIQGFNWDILQYECIDEDGAPGHVSLDFDRTTYQTLVQRYSEIPRGPVTEGEEEVHFDIESRISEKNMQIDHEYMNSRFQKYIEVLNCGNDDLIDEMLDSLHKSFAILSQDEQKYANIFIHDIQRGTAELSAGKAFIDYVAEYQYNAKNDQIHRFADALGLNESKLRDMMNLKITEDNINEFGRLDELEATIDENKAQTTVEKMKGEAVLPFFIFMECDSLIRKFILSGGFDLI